MIIAVMNAILAIAYIEAWKSQDFNGVWSRDLAIPVRCSDQLRYEATDVGRWSFVGSNEPVRNECEAIYMKRFICRTVDVKSSKLWSLQLWTQFKQLHIEAWKSQDFNGVWTRFLSCYAQSLVNGDSKLICDFQHESSQGMPWTCMSKTLQSSTITCFVAFKLSDTAHCSL